ncbi:MAG: DUF6090 family protein, partial [Lutimonas sp.]
MNFLRKIRKKLADENRIVKYWRYALGEIVLVVIGILIALQINNWNAKRIENKQEQKILKILQSVFTFNAIDLQSNIDKSTLTKSKIDILLFFIDHPEIVLAESELRLHALGATGYSTYDPSNGAL